ncbi:MAG: hypothetical protein HGA85_05095 [Nanoarchaeota archaeon]|nr:hypothetical protein [Nanoarchaeota archaeon]
MQIKNILLMMMLISLASASNESLLVRSIGDRIYSAEVISDNDYYRSYFTGEQSSSDSRMRVLSGGVMINDVQAGATSTMIDFTNNMKRADRLTLIFGGSVKSELELSFCDYDKLCEPCAEGQCETQENELTCTDCGKSSEDGYCRIEDDGICDPDCVPGYQYDKPSNYTGCYETSFNAEECEYYGFETCAAEELCTGEELHISGSEGACCSKGICTKKIEEVYDNLGLDEEDEQEDVTWLLISFGIILLISAGIFFVRKNKIIGISFVLISLVAIVYQNQGAITGYAAQGSTIKSMVTKYYTPLDTDFQSWCSPAGFCFETTQQIRDYYINNPDAHIVDCLDRRHGGWCCVVSKGFYEEVKCEGEGFVQEGSLVKATSYLLIGTSKASTQYKDKVVDLNAGIKRTVACPDKYEKGQTFYLDYGEDNIYTGCYYCNDRGAAIVVEPNGVVHLDMYAGYGRSAYEKAAQLTSVQPVVTLGCKYSEEPIPSGSGSTPIVPVHPPETITPPTNVPTEVIAGGRIGFYYLNPSVRAKEDFDLKTYHDIAYAAFNDIFPVVMKCATRDLKCTHATFACEDSLGSVGMCETDGQSLACASGTHICTSAEIAPGCVGLDGNAGICTSPGETITCRGPDTFMDCARGAIASRPGWHIDYCPGEPDEACYSSGSIWNGTACISEPPGYEESENIKFCVETGKAINVMQDKLEKKNLNFKFAMQFSSDNARKLPEFVYDKENPLDAPPEVPQEEPGEVCLEEVKAVVFGDSITVGMEQFGDMQEKFDAVPEFKGKVSVSINGRVNARGSDSYEKFQSEVLSQDPNVVFLWFGMNSYKDNPGAEVDAYRKMIDEMLAKKITPIIMTSLPVCTKPYVDTRELTSYENPNCGIESEDYKYLETLNTLFKDLAKSYNGKVLVIDSRGKIQDAFMSECCDSFYGADGIHIGGKGHRLVSDMVVDQFKSWKEAKKGLFACEDTATPPETGPGTLTCHVDPDIQSFTVDDFLPSDVNPQFWRYYADCVTGDNKNVPKYLAEAFDKYPTLKDVMYDPVLLMTQCFVESSSGPHGCRQELAQGMCQVVTCPDEHPLCQTNSEAGRRDNILAAANELNTLAVKIKPLRQRLGLTERETVEMMIYGYNRGIGTIYGFDYNGIHLKGVIEYMEEDMPMDDALLEACYGVYDAGIYGSCGGSKEYCCRDVGGLSYVKGTLVEYEKRTCPSVKSG